MSMRFEYPRALSNPAPLIPPVVERRRAHHQPEAPNFLWQFLREPDPEAQPRIVPHRPSRLDHQQCGIDAFQGLYHWKPLGQVAEKVSGPAPDIENASHIRRHLGGENSDLISDLMVKTAPPATLVRPRTSVERSDITVARHRRKSAPRPRAAECR